VNAELKKAVHQRAQGRCEYCHYPEWISEAPFQVDHGIAQQHGGLADLQNLAVACQHCNRYKGPNVCGIDPITQAQVSLFHPRKDKWSEHFTWNGRLLVGIARVGRATVATSKMNRPDTVQVRSNLIERGHTDWL
jgi:hypothetical protein